MNTEKSNPSTVPETGAADLIAAKAPIPVMRALNTEEIMLVAGGPEAVIGSGVNPPH